MAQTIEILHYTKEGVMYHSSYYLTTRKFGNYWVKRENTEEICSCPDREVDRQALMGIK